VIRAAVAKSQSHPRADRTRAQAEQYTSVLVRLANDLEYTVQVIDQ
jgi:hypothetical protein